MLTPDNSGFGRNVRITLSQAPLIIALYLEASGVKTGLRWQDGKLFSRKGKRLSAKVKNDFEWLERHYNKMIKHQNNRAFAPHIAPLLLKVDITAAGTAAAFARFLGALSQYRAAYARNLAQSISEAVGIRPPEAVSISLKSNFAALGTKRVRVVDARPANEHDLLLSPLFSYFDMPIAELEEALYQVSYVKRQEAYEAYLRSAPELEDLSYTLEIIAEPIAAIRAQHLGALRLAGINPPTPEYGYRLPPDVSDGGIMQRSFDKSYALYSKLEGDPFLARGSVLFGHRQRFLAKIGFYELGRLYQAKDPLINRLLAHIKRELLLRHPNLHEFMTERAAKARGKTAEVGGKRRLN